MSTARAVATLLVAALLTSSCAAFTPAAEPSQSPAASALASAPSGTLASQSPGPSVAPVPSACPGCPTCPPCPCALASPSASGSPVPSALPSPSTLPSPSPTAAPTPAPTPAQKGIVVLPAGRRAEPSAPQRDVASLVRGNTDLALDLLRRVASGTEPNVVLGPHSISAAFGMLHAGARGETATQMAEVMGWSLPLDRLDAAFNALDQALASRANPKVTLSIVNQLFGQAGYPFVRAYLQELSRQFGAPLATLDFGRPEAARKLINRWVAEQTRQRIRNILPPRQLTPATRLVIVNTTYLKAQWADPFDDFPTQDRSFTRLDGSKVRVPMMTQMGRYPISITDEYEAVELPYVGGKLAMLVVVPERPGAFLRDLTADRLTGIAGELALQDIFLDLPRWSTRTNVKLDEVLRRMGMRLVFQPGAADLTGIADPTVTGEPPLYASSAIHEAWVKVTEKGTEAAAATVIDISTGGGPEISISVDRPFVWFLRDRETGAILFAGRVNDPSVTAD